MTRDDVLQTLNFSGNMPPEVQRARVVSALRWTLEARVSGEFPSSAVWRDQYIAAAIGLLMCGCVEEAACQAKQALSPASMQLPSPGPQRLLDGLDALERVQAGPSDSASSGSRTRS